MLSPDRRRSVRPDRQGCAARVDAEQGPAGEHGDARHRATDQEGPGDQQVHRSAQHPHQGTADREVGTSGRSGSRGWTETAFNYKLMHWIWF